MAHSQGNSLALFEEGKTVVAKEIWILFCKAVNWTSLLMGVVDYYLRIKEGLTVITLIIGSKLNPQTVKQVNICYLSKTV